MTSTDLEPNARLALDALAMEPAEGIPTLNIHILDTAYVEARAGHAKGAYPSNVEQVYLDFQYRCGVCMIDQYIPDNAVTMGSCGYEDGTPRAATTGAERVILDGIVIDSPEAVAQHMENFVFPALEREIRYASSNDPGAFHNLIAGERRVQERFGPSILKVPYGGGFQHFPYLRYTDYGYVNYFTAYVVYPEVIERDFELQADLAVKRNKIAARAYKEGGLPPVLRLDHDMADSRGTLVDIRSLDKMWFPHFARSIQPYLDAGIRLLWHCDGNLMQMVPRLIEVGLGGFQGFQYEDGMDYERICRMKTRDGEPLMIWAGVSSSGTLPLASPAEVRKQLDWLVENGPRAGLFLGASSSVIPGVPWESLDTLIEGLNYYRTHGRN